MKKISLLFIVFSIAFSCAFAQHQGQLSTDYKKLVQQLKKDVDQSWIRENPVLKAAQPSFFTTANEKDYFIGHLEISGEGVPFTWDDNIAWLTYLMQQDNQLQVKKGVAADRNFKGTKITWQRPIKGLLWFNQTAYKAQLDNWHLFGLSDCPGTITFPSLSFKQVVDVPDARTNSITGLAILPYNALFRIESAELGLATTAGLILQGTGYDLNADGIYDVFSYTEEVDEISSYTRLYINVAGQWICRWINFSQECI